ncbi:MAG: hydrogenase maturation protein HypF [Rhodocyclaceae bacterium]|nr:MAG: hydrogenase maturation protein HypF [Rhodocyclaceae bacterium]TND00669.1 MAG: hydrogenase maturation protein HypF [Rhodocyclaceae bacterium]
MSAPGSAVPACVEHQLELPRSAPPVLSMGAWFKNTVCLAQGRQAWVSHTVGDLFQAEACLAHEATARELLQALEAMGGKPVAIAHDLHPDLHSTRFAVQLATELGIESIGVQHHHAHIAAVAAEHGLSGPVLGLSLDGVGLGTDGQAWGGELLSVDGAHFERLGHLRPLALPGGDRAARDPWRMAAAALFDLGRGDEIATRFADQPGAEIIAAMLAKGLNSPRTSSMGRVFDAAAGLLGICPQMEFEAQAAIALEQNAAAYIETHGWPAPLEGGWHIDANGQLDLLHLLGALSSEPDTGYGAALFHATLVAALLQWVMRAAEATGIERLACGGGCFFNKLLRAALVEKIPATGLELLLPRRLLPGDTAISLGQAWVAIHVLEK